MLVECNIKYLQNFWGKRDCLAILTILDFETDFVHYHIQDLLPNLEFELHAILVTNTERMKA
jgi:hypothetical protein